MSSLDFGKEEKQFEVLMLAGQKHYGWEDGGDGNLPSIRVILRALILLWHGWLLCFLSHLPG